MSSGTAESLAVSVHGPLGVLDLVVPPGALAADVAEEYARQAGLSSVPTLCTRIGVVLTPDLPLTRAGVASGDLLVATSAVVPVAGRRAERRGPRPERRSGAAAVLVATLAAVCAVVAGWCASTMSDGPERTAVLALLVAGAVIGVLPVGRFVPPRLIAAPAFAAGAAFAVAWDSQPERLPMVIGVCALAAALAAATGRALNQGADEALQVWIVAGAGVFAITGLCTLGGAPPRLTWSLLLVIAVLAARFVPGVAIDVPDQYLLDLERLAVTAWSARERAGGKRGRSVVPPSAVSAVATRGTRIVTAASTAVLVVALLAAPLLLATATLPVDRIGARCLVGFAGAALLLAARSYRHRAARSLLRAAGLGCWAALLVVLLRLLDDQGRWIVSTCAAALAVVVVLVAVATGRGWRSAWWSRRAEVAEGLCGALALASLVVASGWFRELWEIASLWELSS
ncbi:hypothetical protein ABLE68_06590 [Nocardioides sp. CN2-186]|uniref:hypothetical protein n=1 Tax=Nocardioides tweenelious TaxID=3156607 RepID=UPI0032B481BB